MWSGERKSDRNVNRLSKWKNVLIAHRKSALNRLKLTEFNWTMSNDTNPPSKCVREDKTNIMDIRAKPVCFAQAQPIAKYVIEIKVPFCFHHHMPQFLSSSTQPQIIIEILRNRCSHYSRYQALSFQSVAGSWASGNLFIDRFELVARIVVWVSQPRSP